MPINHEALLDRTAVGFATHASGRVGWSNRAFAAIAAQLGISVDLLAERALRGDELDAGDSGRFEALVHPGDADHLIQVFPTSTASPRETPGDLDDATGVLARGSLRREIETWFARRRERPFALAFLDLDGFKAINDQRGHLTGDKCLAAVGARLRGCVRSADLVGRYGGDEFVLLLAGVTKPAEFQLVADRIEASVREPIPTRSGVVRLDASIGVAFSVGSHADSEDLLAAADRAMYRRKAESAADVADSSRFG